MKIIDDLLTAHKYGDSLNTSLIVCVLMYNIYIMVKIHHGTVVITKLTLPPYKIACCYMLNLLLQSIVFMSTDLYKERHTNGGLTKDLPTFLNILSNLTYTLKIALLLSFMIERIY